MNKTFSIFVCDTLFPEVEHAVRSGNFQDVAVVKLTIRCNGPRLTDENLLKLTDRDKYPYGKGIILGSSCMHKLIPASLKVKGISIFKADNCHDFLAPPGLIRYLLKEQAYIISNGWFFDFRNHLKDWGFDRETARRFFGESTRKIVMLDTGLPDNYQEMLDELSDYMGLPYEVIGIGMDYLNLFLRSQIVDWQKEYQAFAYNTDLAMTHKQSANYTVAFYEISRLMNQTDENAIIRRFLEVLNALCAPSNIVYTPVAKGGMLPEIMFREQGQDTGKDENEGFTIDLFQDEEIGKVTLTGISFPEYKEHYIELSQIIGKVCSLAISNARKFGEMLEQDKNSRELAEKLTEMNATKDKFFSIIGHDLRAPLSTIVGFAELLRKDDSNEFTLADRDKMLMNIGSLSKKTYELLVNLLEWARIQTKGKEIQPVAFELAEVVAETADLIRPSAEVKEIEIRNLIKGPIEVVAHKNSIKTILRNLITNAVKFTNAKGFIEIFAEYENNSVFISIKDNGVGIPESIQSKLFRIDSGFSTAGTAKEQGTGLGLILCRELIERNNGRLGVESLPGAGSRFWFSLPLADPH